MTMELQKNLRIINAHRRILKKKYHVGQIGIFGSVAKGVSRAKSDVDIVVQLSKPIGMFQFLELEEYLGDMLGKKVDLVTKQSLKPLIKEEILRTAVYV